MAGGMWDARWDEGLDVTTAKRGASEIQHNTTVYWQRKAYKNTLYRVVTSWQLVGTCTNSHFTAAIVHAQFTTTSLPTITSYPHFLPSARAVPSPHLAPSLISERC